MATSYNIRAELDHITPSIWREFRIPADLPLPTLHHVLQEAFGWENSHLHAFRCGTGRNAQTWQPSPDLFGFEMPGAPATHDEEGATVGDLLPRVGSKAIYEYDFGDSWQHLLTVLEKQEEDEDGVHLLDGERAGPPEDCGGVPGFMMLRETLATLTSDPDAEIDDWERERIELTFDNASPGQILAALDGFELADAQERVRAVTAPMPPMGAALAEAVSRAEHLGSSHVARMVQLARLDEASEPDVATCAHMMAHLTWFLRHVGPEGLALTAAGYLRPVDVQAVAEQLDLEREWIGKFNRESQTPQVTDLREVMQGVGLLRKAKGHLSVTAAGERLTDDPVGLWRHVAQRLPLGRAEFDRVAGLIVMLDLATQSVVDAELLRQLDEPDWWARQGQIPSTLPAAQERLGEAVSALGWRTNVGAVEGSDVLDAADLTLEVLRRCDVVPADGWTVHWQPTAHGREFLLAALRS